MAAIKQRILLLVLIIIAVFATVNTFTHPGSWEREARGAAAPKTQVILTNPAPTSSNQNKDYMKHIRHPLAKILEGLSQKSLEAVYGDQYQGIKNRELFYHLIQNVSPPPASKTVWALPRKGQKMAISLVEPREHENFRGCLYNLAHVWGGKDISLFVFHSKKNEYFVKKLVPEWKNVQFVNLGVDEMDVNDYNKLMTSVKFYEHFPTDYVLVTQMDVLVRRDIDPEMFDYDYVGAPWGHRPIPERESQVGNGGFSLRNVKAMLEIVSKGDELQENEDTFLSRRTKVGKLPSEQVAAKFSTEMNFAENPSGMHQSYNYLSTEEIVKLGVGGAGLPWNI